MNTFHSFQLADAELAALGSGALWWDAQALLCVSDLHLGRSDRMARAGGSIYPPYETKDTLARLARDLDHWPAKIVICLGDSFDDMVAAGSLSLDEKLWIANLQAGRRWFWMEGNHDPGPLGLTGTHVAELALGPLTFRHISQNSGTGEISGHYHPKVTLHAKGRSITRKAFLCDDDRLIMPAYGTYTGGLNSTHHALSGIMRADAKAILTGKTPIVMPMPR